MYQALISVIVPMYKTEKFLPRAIESILAQDYPHFEMILVDDGSPDRCGQIAEEYSKKDTRITVIHQQNQGLSCARNSGLDIARGEYVFFLDSDDYILANALRELIKASKEGFYEIVVGGWIYLLANNILKDGENRPYQDDIDAIRRDILTMKLFNFAWGRLIKRSIFQSIRFTPNLVGEDIYISPTLFFRAKTACVLPTNYYVYSQENMHSLSNGSDIKNTIRFKYGQFFGMMEHARFAKNLAEDIEKICLKMALKSAIKAFLYQQEVPTLAEKEVEQIVFALEKHKSLPFSFGTSFIRYTILHRWHYMTHLLGKIEVLAFHLRMYFRKQRWKRGGTLKK